MTYVIIIAVLLVVFPLIRCILFNLHNIAVYTVKDIFDYIKNKKWQDFNEFGIDMFIGYFGQGKTCSAVNKIYKIYKKFGDSVVIYSNIKLVGIPYVPLVNFQQLVELQGDNIDGRKGSVVLIDEVSNLLSHRNYASFPLELLGILTQPRKCNVYILATCQRWFMVDKIFRSLVRNCYDLSKYWRFQHQQVYDAWDYEMATSPNMIQRKGNIWNFITNKIYDSYDTKEQIESYKATDFISNEEAIVRKGLDGSIVSNELGVNKPSKKLKKRLKK